jgi:hypothetical protein
MPSLGEAVARSGPEAGPYPANNDALAEEDAASTTDPIEIVGLAFSGQLPG